MSLMTPRPSWGEVPRAGKSRRGYFDGETNEESVSDGGGAIRPGCGQLLGFLLAVLVVAVWGATGPYFGYSDTWQSISSSTPAAVRAIGPLIVTGAALKSGSVSTVEWRCARFERRLRRWNFPCSTVGRRGDSKDRHPIGRAAISPKIWARLLTVGMGHSPIEGGVVAYFLAASAARNLDTTRRCGLRRTNDQPPPPLAPNSLQRPRRNGGGSRGHQYPAQMPA